MSIYIEGRRVFVFKRELSQTVNICDLNNRRGVYDWTVRLYQQKRVKDSDINKYATIKSLIEWLSKGMNGAIEKQPQEEVDPSTLEPYESDFTPDDTTWIERAKQIAEECINELVREFLDLPYLHRVEHSIHARLHTLLSAQPHFARHFTLSEDGILTQPIHKEWPETKPRPDKDNRRGNFDLAILPPGQLSKCSCQEFSEGRVAPPIAIEMGLNYGISHLFKDAEKFLNSNIQHGYLVHLIREKQKKQKIQTYNDIITDIRKKVRKARKAGRICGIHVAFAQVIKREKHLKLLHDPEIYKV